MNRIIYDEKWLETKKENHVEKKRTDKVDDGYLTKISRDIVESLEQVKRIDTDIFLEREF